MNVKKILLILLVFCVLAVAIGQVSADTVEVSNFSELRGNVSAGNDVVLTNNITPGAGESFGDGIEIKSSVTVDGNGSCIDANQTGRIFRITNSNAVLTLKNITLKNGYTTDKGGAIYSINTGLNLIFNDNVIFYNNTAYEGGAIYYSDEWGTGNNLNINAIYSNIIFSNNTATNGGAILASLAHVNINSTNSNITFSNNTATNGGAICSYANVNINSTNSNITFSNNTATNGGAIYSTNVIINSTNSNITFNNNTANIAGGAIYSEMNVNINSTNSNITFNNNNAYDCGAILSNWNVNINSTNSNIIFNNNNAYDGGAIWSDWNVNINSTNSNITFKNNTATNGGAIYTSAENVNINGINSNISFKNNTANKSGGAIYTDSGYVNINGINSNISFKNNTAYEGGAIYANQYSVSINNVIFYGNNATGNGTAIYLKYGKNSNLENCFWGLNYKNQTEIINDNLIYNGGSPAAPNWWLLLNIIKPEEIICETNNTFQLVFNQKTNGTKIENIKAIPALILVNLTENTNTVPSQAIFYFNYTTNQPGQHTINVLNSYNGKKITTTTFTIGYSFTQLAELIDQNPIITLNKNYDFYKIYDANLINGIKITRNTTIDGNGSTLDAKNLAIIFQVEKGVTLTLKNINLANARIAIMNNRILDLTKVISKSSIYNKGVITSGVNFIVYPNKVTTYDSYLVRLTTDNGIPIMVSNLKYSDDQGHNYKAYIYNKGFYVNYVPEGITGHVTFNNVKLNGFTNLTSTGSLDITKYPKSNKIVNSVVKNIKDIVPVVKNTLISNKKITNVVSTVKNIITKSTIDLNTMFKSFKVIS